MKRTFLIALLFLASAGALAWFFLQESPEEEAIARAAHRQGVASRAILTLLDRRQDLPVEAFTMGRELTSGAFDFRGAVSTETTSLPLYGVAELTCDELSPEAQCWRFTVLERDGEPWPLKLESRPIEDREAQGVPGLAEEHPQEANRQEQRAKDEPTPADGSAETQGALDLQPAAADSLEGQPPAGGPEQIEARASVEPVEPEASSPEPEEERAPRFVVTAPIVNGRSGPGTDHEILLKVGQEMRLALEEEQDGWGRFSIFAEDGSLIQDAWIFRDLVTERPGS